MGDPYRTRVQKLTSFGAKEDVKFRKYIGSIDNLDEVIENDEFLCQYKFYLNELKNSLKHSFSEDSEEMFSRMNLFGGMAWTEQYSYLMSNTEADFRGGKKSMNSLQSMLKSTDREDRRSAYEAQLATYPKIKDADFWRTSLKTITDNIDLFINETVKM